MIWESSYWKSDLLRVAKTLKARSRQRKWPERSLVNIEKEVFYAFYGIRKLIEARKLCDAVANRVCPARSYRSLGKPVTYFNWHRIDELFDLSHPRSKHLKLRYICNQIIHSYVFSTEHGEEGGLAAILFCSDRHRHKELYRLEISEVTKVLNEVGSDYPNKMAAHFDPGKKDYTIGLATEPESGRTASGHKKET